MFNVVLAICTIFGSLGGFVLIWQTIKRLRQKAAHSAQARSTKRRPYYCVQADVTLRCIAFGKHYSRTRTQRIVSLQDGLEGVAISTGPTANAKMTMSLLRGGTLKESPIDPTLRVPDARSAFIAFDRPLDRGESIEFVLQTEMRSKPKKSLLPFLQWSSAGIVEHLVLRVIFEDTLPERVVFRTQNLVGEQLEPDEVIAIDQKSGDASKTLVKPKPGLLYSLTW
jgi:hypothetical protein